MKSIRLQKEIEQELKQLAELENKTESALIREDLVEYLSTRRTTVSSYELDKSLFGQVVSLS